MNTEESFFFTSFALHVSPFLISPRTHHVYFLSHFVCSYCLLPLVLFFTIYFIFIFILYFFVLYFFAYFAGRVLQVRRSVVGFILMGSRQIYFSIMN